MKAHRIATKFTETGTVTLKDLPFQAGEAVEIIILERPYQVSQSNPYPLQGKQPYSYEDPFGPATPDEDWEILQ
jgi:hypothetical protein